MVDTIGVARDSPWVLPIVLILNALTLAVAFQWNTLVQLTIDTYTSNSGTLNATFVYTGFITLLYIFIILGISRVPGIRKYLM